MKSFSNSADRGSNEPRKTWEARLPVALRRLLRPMVPRLPRFIDSDRSALPKKLLFSIQEATFNYKFNGVSCIKNPFDLALYGMLLSDLRPKTVIEIGSASGGSGIWFATQLKGLGLESVVHSFDIEPVEGKNESNLFFHFADIYKLEESELPEILKNCERPLLVVEDGPHTYFGCLAALEFFDSHLTRDDYIVIEDGILHDLGYRAFKNGPNRAIRDFLERRQNSYTIDRKYCDFFGYNVTWNTNGYMRKL